MVLLVGECRPVHQILTLFRPKNIIFYTRSQTRFLIKIQTIFQTWPLGGNYVIISYTRAQTKNFANAFRTRIFLLLRSYSFGIGTTNTFIHFRSSLENHTRFQTKQKQKGKKTNLYGGTYLYGLYREVPHPPPLLGNWVTKTTIMVHICCFRLYSSIETASCHLLQQVARMKMV